MSRFLDITKAEMLFAKGVLFVEGDVEMLLIREFAEILGTPLDRLGISVCNVSGTHFSHVAILAKELQIPFVIMTDGDKNASVNGLSRSISVVETVYPLKAQELRKLFDDEQFVEAEISLRDFGIFLNSWTLEVELIQAGNHDIMKDVFAELGEELGVGVRAGSTNIDRYLASPTDDNMTAILNSIGDSRWGKGRYAHRLLNHIRSKADALPTDAEKYAIVPKYIRDGINSLISAIGQSNAKSSPT